MITTVVPVFAVTVAGSKLLIILSVNVTIGSLSENVCVALAIRLKSGELSITTLSLSGIFSCVISLKSGLSYNVALTGLFGVWCVVPSGIVNVQLGSKSNCP
jgi:hypothetical protein